MLEGSFRPSSSATALPSYGIAKSGFTDQSSAATTMRRKDPPGSSFAPVHDRHLPEFESEDHQQQSGSPPGPRYFKPTQQSHSSTIHNNLSPHSQSTQVAGHQSMTDPMFKADPRTQEVAPKNSSIGPMRAKKKPAGSACNSCHRLKTRCSGGHPCDRCAAHKVPCQFDRDLIYRSPLASSSQQASVRNGHTMSKVDSGLAPKSRSRGGAKTSRKVSTASAAPTVAAPVSGMSQPPSAAPVLPISLPQVVRLSPTPNDAPSVSAVHQPSPLSAINSKPGYRSTPVSTPALSEAYVSYEPNLSHPNGLHLRLAALENSVSGLLQVLRAHQSTNSGLFVSASDHRPPLSPPTPPTLAMTGSSSFGPEKDHAGDIYRLGSPNSSCPIGDPLSKGILSPGQLQYLYDVFVEFCLPNLPILHGVQIALIRARSSFLFTVMVTIGARFCSSQSVAHIPPNNSLRPTSTGGKVDLSQIMIDEQTYARLVALAHLHLSATLLKATHSLEDVRAILFLACWALVSNEDPNGTPNRWVLIGHAGRIGRSIGLDRCASELQGCNAIWNNPDIHEARREQLDAIKTDEALRAIETILSSNLRLEPSRNYFPPLHMPVERESNFSIVKLSTGSPHQYDIVSAAQIEALAELAEIWAAVNSFLSVADDRSRSLNGEQLIELGERHNQTMDTWAKKWTWQGSSWAPLLGVNLRTIRLLSESLRITLNLAFTNVLYAITGASKPTPSRLQESLAMALERVSGSSTAVIQAHRDSVREGFSLAFAPDLVTDGLVSAAITVLQLASPIGLAPVLGKPGCKENTNPTPNQNAASTHVAAIVNEDRPLTPHSGEDAGTEINEVNESNASTAHMVYFHQTNHQKDSTRESRSSSPSSTPSRLSKASSPRGNSICSFFADTKGAGNQAIGKKCFMDPPVAAHYIRMATDVLQASDRSQTRLGTIMASKIMKLAAQAGLISSSNTTSNIGPIANATTFPDTVVTREDRPSISSTSSLSSARNVETSHGENSHHNPHCKISAHQRENTPNHLSQVRQDEDEDDLANDTLPKPLQEPPNNVAANLHALERLDGGTEGVEDPKEGAKEEGDDESRGDVHCTEENQSATSLQKRESDMMEEDQ